MDSDLSGGLSPAFESFLGDRPADPAMRDSATLWIIDDGGELALPRVTIDAIGGSWDTPWAQINMAHADGRRWRVWSQLAGHAGQLADGRAMARGAGGLRFECVEPFRHWAVEFDGEAMASTVSAQLSGAPDGDPVPLAFRFEAEMAVPPWLMGGMTAEAAERMRSGEAAALMGGVRYEQLCRVRGHVRLDGADHAIAGTGMRVRRQGVRGMGAATGHVQHSALFPSGRAFGAIAFAPGADGISPFNEAFLHVPGRGRVAARVVHAPWMTRLAESADDASLILDSEWGEVRIEGETRLTLFDHHLFEMAGNSVLAPGTARYIWDGEEATGLIERCTLRDQLKGEIK